MAIILSKGFFFRLAIQLLNVLVKDNKDTGKVDQEILLKDKKPEYQVDEYGGYLCYKPND